MDRLYVQSVEQTRSHTGRQSFIGEISKVLDCLCLRLSKAEKKKERQLKSILSASNAFWKILTNEKIKRSSPFWVFLPWGYIHSYMQYKWSRWQTDETIRKLSRICQELLGIAFLRSKPWQWANTYTWCPEPRAQQPAPWMRSAELNSSHATKK